MIKNKRALIVGCNGQDGTLLRKSLLADDFDIVGITRNAIIRFGKGLNGEAYEKVTNIILCRSEIRRLLVEFEPTEVYYLAAHHTSSEILEVESVEEYTKCNNTHVIGLLNILNTIRELSLGARLFYASSALVFMGKEIQGKVTENSTIAPVGYYGLTKAQGTLICEHYRNKHSIYASVGHLFNHESHLRQAHYLSHKIISTARRISNGEKIPLIIGNLGVIVDWGYAPDFVEAFRRIMKLDTPDSFIVSTGEGRTVEEFVQEVFNHFELDYKKYVTVNSSIQKRETPPRIGDPSKLCLATNWRPTYFFSEMIKRLINDHVDNYIATNSWAE